MLFRNLYACPPTGLQHEELLELTPIDERDRLDRSLLFWIRVAPCSGTNAHPAGKVRLLALTGCHDVQTTSSTYFIVWLHHVMCRELNLDQVDIRCQRGGGISTRCTCWCGYCACTLLWDELEGTVLATLMLPLTSDHMQV